MFAGTVNHTEYLRDETGARRFWPVLCGSIDIDALARDRDQLWAEAKHRYSSGEKWWLDTSALIEIAAQEQAARYQGDPWEEIVGPWLEVRSSTSVSEVLEKCVNRPQAQWTQADKRRFVAAAMAYGNRAAGIALTGSLNDGRSPSAWRNTIRRSGAHVPNSTYVPNFHLNRPTRLVKPVERQWKFRQWTFQGIKVLGSALFRAFQPVIQAINDCWGPSRSCRL